jgi:hypothetical protein
MGFLKLEWEGRMNVGVVVRNTGFGDGVDEGSREKLSRVELEWSRNRFV